MQFTVRDIFALTLIAALVAFALAMMRQQQIAQHELIEAETRLKSQNASLSILESTEVAPKARVEWLEAKAIAKRSAIEQFQVIQEKYGAIEPRGDDTVSVRSIPMIVDEEYDGSNWRMRIRVPEGGGAFLKLGVIQASAFSSVLPPESSLLTTFTLDQTGPFERNLSPGLHDVDLASRKNPENSLLQYRVSIDERPLLVATSQVEGVTSKAASWLGAREQIDFPVGKGQVLGQWSFGGSSGSNETLILWVENTSSGFELLPEPHLGESRDKP